MSAEPPEDAKPKLNLVISLLEARITVKVKANMQFKKIFEVAEKRFAKDPGTLRFVYDGERLSPTDTPAERSMEDGDVIDAHLQQLGGCFHPCYLFDCC
ncbi:ubiquitin-like protein [Lactarius tabidus]